MNPDVITAGPCKVVHEVELEKEAVGFLPSGSITELALQSFVQKKTDRCGWSAWQNFVTSLNLTSQGV